MISRTITRRLNQLEDRFKPGAEPQVIIVNFIGADGKVDGTMEVRVGPGANDAQMSSGVLR